MEIKETVKDMLTTDEVVEILGISKMTLARWRKAGKIPYVEFPRKTAKYYRSDVEKILREGL